MYLREFWSLMGLICEYVFSGFSPCVRGLLPFFDDIAMIYRVREY